MSVARVYLPTDRKYKSVKTSSILKFEPGAFDSDDEEQKKKLYQLKEGKGKGVSCQILRIRATLKKLAESVGAKRLHVPKLNASQIKAGWQSDSDRDSVTMAKTIRKVEKHVKKQASKAASQDIVETYLQVTKEKLGKQVGKVQSAQKVQKVEESGISSHILTEYTDGNDSGGSQAENDECSSSKESMEQLQKKFRKMRKAYIEMTHEVEQQKDMLKTLTIKYEQLKTSKSYPLTEKTGRQILAVLENNRWEGMPHSTCDEKFHSKDPQTEPKIGSLKGEETYIGKGTWISTISYEALLREKESSKFVSGLSRSVWGVKPLSERCVRKQINTQANELTPKKKAAVANFFEIWMRDKRKYPEDLVADELKKLNKYLNGAITSARSTIAPKRRKSHLKDDPTLPLYSGHSEDESNRDKENNFPKKEKQNTETTIIEQTNNVLKEDLTADKKYDENINNLEMDSIKMMDKNSTDSTQEEFSDLESITSTEKDQDLTLDNDDSVELAVEEDE